MKLKKLNPFRRKRAHRNELRRGDIIYTPLLGVWRHYGIVINECPFGNHTIRTVLRESFSPVNQSYDQFSAGQRVYILPYPSDAAREEVARKALSEKEFDYNLLFNNCENFVRRAHGLNNVSLQVLTGAGLLSATIILAILRRRFPSI
ncbi:MAG: hypothetical protein KDI61_04425 [Alphaproteobacteria bacterium]|nr:hypothetical protein [Alphaproteobacteria bacterium]